MSVALTSLRPPASTRQDKLRVMVVDDSVVIRGLISRWIDAEPDMEVVGLAAHRSRRRQPARAHQARRRRARYRNAGARRHFGAAATAGEEARPRHHHGLDADPPQRGDQLQGAVARRRRLHSEAGKHARGDRGRDLPPRSDPEDPPSRRQGAAGARRPRRSPSLAPARERAREVAGPAGRRTGRRSCNWRAGRSACWRRACC